MAPARPAPVERRALPGGHAATGGVSILAWELDLRRYASWCHTRRLALFGARRADIDCFARDLEARDRARATITRRLCTIAGLYRYAVKEELLDHSPAVHVRRPRLDYESHATALDRNELGGLLVAAGLGPPAEHALISLLALNRLRVSEAIGADIEAMGIERGHRTLVITRKGGKVVTIPLAPRTARAIDLAIGERCQGPVFLAADGHRLDRHGAGRVARRAARLAGITKPVWPHTLRHGQHRRLGADPPGQKRHAGTGPSHGSCGSPTAASPPRTTAATCGRGTSTTSSGEKLRSGSAEAQAALSRQDRYQDVAANLPVKEVRIAGLPPLANIDGTYGWAIRNTGRPVVRAAGRSAGRRRAARPPRPRRGASRRCRSAGPRWRRWP